eukprot:scaffold520_cov160-Ochromonas_danica.AAC.2
MLVQIFTALIFLQLVAVLLAEVTVLKTNQYIYDKSPKLRIRGSGFDAEDHDIILELGVGGQTNLAVDKDFMISKDPDGEGVILKLLGNRKWADLSKRTSPVALILNAVRFSIDPEKKNLLPSPVIVAQVLNTPNVEAYKRVIYQSASYELRIDGTGFIGAKKVDFYFKPPLVKEVAYEDVTPYPLTKNEVILRLRYGYSWREERGPLYLVGVDTGGGPVKVNGDEGVLIADVQANHELHDITVEPTASFQLIYADEPSLLITGTGFNPVGNTFRFANGLLGNNVNYSTLSVTDTSIQLRLTPGSYWRKNFDNLPGVLTLLGVNTCQGYVAVGPSNAAKGRDIATVFERPAIYSNNKKIFKTHSHELHVMGTGFPLANTDYKPQLKFNPPLKEGVDYKLRVVARDDLEITLLDSRSWRPTAGPLIIMAINTRGDEAGWVTFPGEGVHVAEVVEDFDPPFKAGVDYELELRDKNRVVIHLRAGVQEQLARDGLSSPKTLEDDGGLECSRLDDFKESNDSMADRAARITTCFASTPNLSNFGIKANATDLEEKASFSYMTLAKFLCGLSSNMCKVVPCLTKSLAAEVEGRVLRRSSAFLPSIFSRKCHCTIYIPLSNAS